MDPPENLAGKRTLRHPPHGHIGDHQEKNEQRDEAGFRGKRTEGARTDDEAAEGERSNGDGATGGKCEGEPKIECTEETVAFEKREAETGGDVVHGNQGECTETPKDEGMRQTRQRTFPDDLGLAQHLGKEDPEAAGEGAEPEIGVGAGVADAVDDESETHPKQNGRRADKSK